MKDAAPACHAKTAHHPDKLKRQFSSRLSRIEGQIRGVSRMIQEDVYCDDVLHQILSIEAALTGVKKMLLEAHMKSCVLDQISRGDQSVVEEFMVTLGKMIK